MKIRIYPQSLLETVWQQDKLLFTPEAAQPPLCLRCGQPLDRRLVINALSRYADVHICEACGMDEALRDANRCPLPLTEWAAVKNGLSQQQTDFEDPLLTTSCTFEDLFQQGSRPASEIAYSRSDYDGWKWWTTWHQCQKDTPVLEVAREIDAFQNALFHVRCHLNVFFSLLIFILQNHTPPLTVFSTCPARGREGSARWIPLRRSERQYGR